MDLQKEFSPEMKKYFEELNKFSIPTEILNKLFKERDGFHRKCERENKYGKQNDITHLCKVRIEE
jgi:hypothetical protein